MVRQRANSIVKSPDNFFQRSNYFIMESTLSNFFPNLFNRVHFRRIWWDIEEDICLGCMGFGDAGNGQHSWTIDEEHSREIIKRALELGMNFFDTAIAYQSGTSEQYVGRAVRDFAKREDVVVATKFLPRTEDEIAAGVTGQQHIKRMLNTSLRNGDG